MDEHFYQDLVKKTSLIFEKKLGFILIIILGSILNISMNSIADQQVSAVYDSKMGPDCGKCHNSSVAPHLVKRQPLNIIKGFPFE